MPQTAARVEEIASAYRHLAIGVIAAFAIIIGALWAQSYYGRVDIVKNNRRNCEHVAKPRDSFNALGWRTAQHRALSQGQPHFAATYAKIADFLEGPKGARADCRLRFPDPSPWPWA